jgi:hypothetical protein
VAKLSQLHSRSCGQAGLAYAALAAEQQDPHACIVEL